MNDVRQIGENKILQCRCGNEWVTKRMGCNELNGFTSWTEGSLNCSRCGKRAKSFRLSKDGIALPVKTIKA
ncbi:MAG: hypothetical protein WC119_04600 [Synergistaceae bacterium]